MNADWLKISSEIEAIAIDFRRREAEIPCEQRIELCTRLASIRRLIDRLDQPSLSSTKEGGVRAAANVCALATAEELHGLGFDRYEDDGREHITKKARQCALYAFEGFVPREEKEAALEMAVRFNSQLSNVADERNAAQADNAKLREEVERITSGYHRRADELDAQYRELISTRAQLKDMTDQFFAVSLDNAALRGFVEKYATAVSPSVKKFLASLTSPSARPPNYASPDTALQSSHADWIVESATPGATFKVNIDHKRRTIVVSLLTIAPSPLAPKSEAQERGAPFDEERTKEKP